MEVVIVAAVAANGVIGAEGELPWYYPEDLRHFRETTTGHPVVVGRRTYESIVERLGGPLPERTTVVLSTKKLDLPEGAVLAGSVEAALEAARAAEGGDTVFVAGGASVYEQFLPHADRMVLTELDAAFDGDVYFPEWEREEWIEVDRDEREELAFVEYERRET